MRNDFVVVRNYNDANVLISRGHKLIKIDRDKFDRGRLIFIFNWSSSIFSELNNISNRKKGLK